MWGSARALRSISTASAWPLYAAACSALKPVGCDIHTHAPAKKPSTNFILYPLVLRTCSTNPLGHGHGYEYHSPAWAEAPQVRIDIVVVAVHRVLAVEQQLQKPLGSDYKCRLYKCCTPAGLITCSWGWGLPTLRCLCKALPKIGKVPRPTGVWQKGMLELIVFSEPQVALVRRQHQAVQRVLAVGVRHDVGGRGEEEGLLLGCIMRSLLGWLETRLARNTFEK